ncbi:MAG: cation diffusion facilitator family transporter [Elusimicrobiota bacterium]|jgi:cation diffusion facilitator family transporter
MSTARNPEAAREKNRVALSSVVAAVFLTGTKLGIGLWTNSLGILSEAAHSGLDLLAAAVTLWAVNVAARPADRSHTYGHGKVENLSALFETSLLLATCAWIMWEAVHRLFFRSAEVEVNIYSFGVIIFSIIIDFSRSRALKRAADKYQSQALEADALHFSTDIWSSCVVLLGLGGVLASRRFGLPWLAQADAVAALGVALIVVWVCYQLGRKSIDDLLDAVPRGLQDQIAAAAKVPGVCAVRQVRVRRSGPTVFADAVIAVGNDTPLEKSHDIADASTAAIRRLLPDADVVTHVEPCADKHDPLTLARVLAARHGLGAHAIRIYEESGRRAIEMHLEVAKDMRLDQAHKLASAFESELRAVLPDLLDVVTHIEPAEGDHRIPEASSADEARIQKSLFRFLSQEKLPVSTHHIKVRPTNGELDLSLHCTLAPDTDIQSAHDLTVRMEKYLRAELPDLGRVVIHSEPIE